MTGRDLSAEMDLASSRVRRDHLDKLRGLGVPFSSLGALNAVQHTVGIARVQPLGDGLFDYSEDGLPACLVAVVENDRDLGDAGIFDLVAFASDNPGRWWWRTGAAFALGGHLLESDEPVRVVATPVEWLAYAGDALCLLDWSRRSSAWPALRAGPPLQFTNDALRQKVRNALVQAAPMPPMETLCA